MQFITADLFKDFPAIRFIIPHGGGAVPYHWGRYRGLAQDLKRPPLDEMMRHNVFFDTCVYHQPGIDLLFKVVSPDNILFGSEMVGAVRGIDPLERKTGDAPKPSNHSSERLLGFAARGEVHDERLWMGIARATGAPGNTSCLVGTPEQIAAAVLEYYRLGIHSFLLRGFENPHDTVAIGRDLIPLIKAGAEQIDRQAEAAE